MTLAAARQLATSKGPRRHDYFLRRCRKATSGLSDTEVGKARFSAHLLLEGHPRRQLELQVLNRTIKIDVEGHGEGAPGRIAEKWRRLGQ